MALMMTFMVVFWGAVIFGIVWLIRDTARRGGPSRDESSANKESPLGILERRFAEGAITGNDYTARRRASRRDNGEQGAQKEEPVEAS